MTQSRKARKETQSPSVPILEDFRALFEVEFREIEGCVIAVVPGQPKPRSDKAFRNSDKAQAETEENKQHFDYCIGNTAWERWQNNLALAVSVKKFWEFKLSDTFPGREFVLFIYNEIAQAVTENDTVINTEIKPALRLWSASNDLSRKRYNTYDVSKATPDKIKIRTSTGQAFVPWTDAFTKSGELRKAFIRSIKEADLEYLHF